ncbi:MAG: hypothetical protein WAK63_14150 [Xanthobacteraceae bacterium]
MSEQTIRVSRSLDVSAAMPWLVAIAVYLLLMVLGNRLLGDADTYWHITLGRLILEHRALPTGAALSQTVHATHWVAYEWLSQIAYAAAYALGGWVAVAALTAAAAAAAFGLLARYLLNYWQPTPVIAAVLAALVLTSPHIMARPHVLALPLMVAWIAALIRAVDTARPPWWLVPLMTLWANLHGSFIFGLAMTGVIAAEAIWLSPAPQRRRAAADWIAFAALALAAACLNPYGPELILATIRILSLGQALSLIVEWRPQDFSKLGAYEMVVLAAIGLALWRGVRLPPFRILMLLGVLHFSLAQSRHADLLGMLAPLFLARPLAEQFSAFAATESVAALRRPLPRSWLAAAAGLLLAAAVTGASAARDAIAPAAAITPANAVKALTGVTRGPILNDYALGGYLDFVGIAPFIDGRTELYGEAFVVRYHRAVNLENLPDFLRLLDENRIEATLLLPATPAVALLDRLPDWRRVYADDIAVVHARRTPRQD